MSQRIDVFLLTENRLLREALMRIFGEKSDLALVGATPFSPQLVKEVAVTKARVLLSDSGLNSFTDLQIIPELRTVLPELRVLLIGMESDASTFLRAVRAGVLGYVLKDASSIDVAAAVRSVPMPCVSQTRPGRPPLSAQVRPSFGHSPPVTRFELSYMAHTKLPP